MRRSMQRHPLRRETCRSNTKANGRSGEEESTRGAGLIEDAELAIQQVSEGAVSVFVGMEGIVHPVIELVRMLPPECGVVDEG